jgi:hypothetical protein
VNTAERLQTAAAPDQVVVAASTWEALKGDGRGFALSPLTVKNKEGLIDAYSLRGLAVEGEVALHVPVRSAGRPAWIIRCLADGRLVALHPRDCDLGQVPLLSAAPEWADVDLGTPADVATLPAQAADGRLVRSELRLPGNAFAGLLAASQTRPAGG